MGPRDTRRLLLDAAAEQFAAHGVRRTRVHAIVKRSKVNERLIYHHFGSKDGLYRAVIADQWTDRAGAWRQTLTRASRLAPREGLALAFSALFDRFIERPLMIPLAFHESMSGWKAVPRARLAQVPREVRTLYSRGQREGAYRRDCSFETLYIMLIGALSWLIVMVPRFSDMRKRGERRPAELTETAKQVIELVLDGASHANERHNRSRSST